MRYGIKPVFKGICRLGAKIKLCQIHDEYEILENGDKKTGRRLAEWLEKGDFAFYEIDSTFNCVQLVCGR